MTKNRPHTHGFTDTQKKLSKKLHLKQTIKLMGGGGGGGGGRGDMIATG